MPLHVPTADDIRCIGEVALAVKMLESGYFHFGVLIRDEHNNVRLIHLAFHKDLRNESPPPEYAWSELSGLDDFLGDVAVSTFRALWKKYGEDGVPYSFTNDTEFDDDIEMTTDGPGTGFTCATFVLRVLESVGIFLIQEDTWAEREGDKAWQQWVIAEFERRYGDEERAHIEKLKQAVGEFRIRPTDLIVAAQTSEPSSFDTVQSDSAKVVAMLSN